MRSISLSQLYAPRNLRAACFAVALASTCRGLRAPTAAVVAELRRRHEAVKALLAKAGKSFAAVGEATELSWGHKGLTVADCRALADVIKSNGLPRLEKLYLGYNRFGAEGMQALAEVLGRGALPSLTYLTLHGNSIGDAGASALGAALGRGALPRLQVLYLDTNGLSSAGLIALAPGLRARPQLNSLYLGNNMIGEDGMAALVKPGEGVLPSLETLSLIDNQVTDAGAATVVAALSKGALLSLQRLHGKYSAAGTLGGNPASAAARAAVDAALASCRG